MEINAEYKITKNIFGNSVLKTFSLYIVPACKLDSYSLSQESFQFDRLKENLEVLLKGRK
jgi:hypothetical protein